MPRPMLGTPIGADRPARHPLVRNAAARAAAVPTVRDTAAARRTAAVRANFARRRRAKIRMTGPGAADIALLAGAVPDPELPMISLADLGVLRAVEVADNGAITLTITPTYSGCPAIDMMSADMVDVLGEAGYTNVTVQTVLKDAWSSDDMSQQGAAALAEAGIAPPTHLAGEQGPEAVPCPHCASRDTEQLSRFGSTSCKALYRCRACLEPFDYFKVH